MAGRRKDEGLDAVGCGGWRGGVKMDADEKICLGLAGEQGAFFEFDKGIVVASEQDLITLLFEDEFYAAGDIKGEGFFLHAQSGVLRADVVASVAGIKQDAPNDRGGGGWRWGDNGLERMSIIALMHEKDSTIFGDGRVEPDSGVVEQHPRLVFLNRDVAPLVFPSGGGGKRSGIAGKSPLLESVVEADGLGVKRGK